MSKKKSWNTFFGISRQTVLQISDTKIWNFSKQKKIIHRKKKIKKLPHKISGINLSPEIRFLKLISSFDVFPKVQSNWRFELFCFIVDLWNFRCRFKFWETKIQRNNQKPMSKKLNQVTKKKKSGNLFPEISFLKLVVLACSPKVQSNWRFDLFVLRSFLWFLVECYNGYIIFNNNVFFKRQFSQWLMANHQDNLHSSIIVTQEIFSRIFCFHANRLYLKKFR